MFGPSLPEVERFFDVALSRGHEPNGTSPFQFSDVEDAVSVS